MLKESPVPPTCAAEGCSALATLIHDAVPYCGKHALELLEKSGRAETPADFMRTDRMSEATPSSKAGSGAATPNTVAKPGVPA